MSYEKIRTGVVYIDAQPFEGDLNNESLFTQEQKQFISMAQREVQHRNTTMMIDTQCEGFWIVNENNTRNGRIITHTSEW